MYSKHQLNAGLYELMRQIIEKMTHLCRQLMNFLTFCILTLGNFDGGHFNPHLVYVGRYGCFNKLRS